MLFAVGTKTYLELLQNIIPETTTVKVSQTYRSAVSRIIQFVLEPVASPFIYDEHTIPVVARLQFFFGQFLLLNLNAILLCQIAQRIGIRKLLMLHNKVYRASTLTTSKAFTQILGRRYHKRRCGVIMKRAQSFQINTGTFQRYKIRHYIHDVCRIQYFIYR